MDAVIAQDIASAINHAIDSAAFAGSGSSGQPTGILATTGVFDNTTAGATNTTDLVALATGSFSSFGCCATDSFLISAVFETERDLKTTSRHPQKR